jgi:hypothetical protein
MRFPSYEKRDHTVVAKPLKTKVLFYPLLPDFRKNTAFSKVLRLRPFVLVRPHADEDEYGTLVVQDKSHMGWLGTEPGPSQ